MKLLHGEIVEQLVIHQLTVVSLGHRRQHEGTQEGVHVVVQFYPWFNFYFPLFYTHYHSFSNSLIIHIVISLPERPILVRWMSLETQ